MKGKKREQGNSSHVSHAAEPEKNERDVSSGNHCPVCEGRHNLDDCRQFNDLTLEEQSKISRKKKLCYGCYSPISPERNAKSCKKTKKVSGLQLRPSNKVAWLRPQEERWCLDK